MDIIIDHEKKPKKIASKKEKKQNEGAAEQLII